MSIKHMVGQIPVKVEKGESSRGQDELVFVMEGGDKFTFTHIQDCCESVGIEDINGDLSDLVGTTLLVAEERTEWGETEWGTYTWTFYTFRSLKGSVDVRWCGESNGYYSESVDLEFIEGYDNGT